MKKAVVLFSAGVESTSLLVHYLKKDFYVYPVYIRAGMPWESVERGYAIKVWFRLKKQYKNMSPLRTLFMEVGPARHRFIPLDDSQIEIPLRNMVLTVKTALVALRKGAEVIGIGSLGVYPFPDNNRDYFDALQRLISEGARREIRIETPFMGMEKWEVIRTFRDSVPFELTFSCASPVKGIHCGVCAKCRERKEGFLKAGVEDPTPYMSS